MKLSFICSFTLLCLLCSCKKSKPRIDDTDPNSYLFSADALAYVQLPLNTYYIYKDSASGTLDSVVVTQSVLETKFHPEESGNDLYIWHLAAYYYQQFTLLLTNYSGSSPQDWFYGIATNGPNFFINSDTTSWVDLVEIDTLNNIRVNNYAFFYPEGGSVFSLTPTIIPSMTIEGKSYSNIVFCSDFNSPDTTADYYLETNYYWAKGVGIIKRRIKTSNYVKTENLVRYQ